MPNRVSGYHGSLTRKPPQSGGPHETAPVHTHLANPVAVYVYLTDDAVMEFTHMTGFARPPVKAGGAILWNPPTQTGPVELVRLELKSDPEGSN